MKKARTKNMTTVFKSGTSLAVRLPKDFALPIGRVVMRKNDQGNIKLISTNREWPEDLIERFSEELDWSRAKPRKSTLVSPAPRGLEDLCW
jgi:virulence-associated protein VagC